jgi:hypothetical protein
MLIILLIKIEEPILKPADYEISLNKFWKENVTQDSDNVSFLFN